MCLLYALGTCPTNCLPGHLSICGTVITPHVRHGCHSKWIITDDLITHISTPWLPCGGPGASPLTSALAEAFLKGLLPNHYSVRKLLVHEAVAKAPCLPLVGVPKDPLGYGKKVLKLLFIFDFLSYPFKSTILYMFYDTQNILAQKYMHINKLVSIYIGGVNCQKCLASSSINKYS